MPGHLYKSSVELLHNGTCNPRSRQTRDSLDLIVIQTLQRHATLTAPLSRDEVLGLLNHHVAAKSDACMYVIPSSQAPQNLIKQLLDNQLPL